MADCAWCFWGNLAGKVAGCAEIWPDKQQDRELSDFAWHNEATGRSFRQDMMEYQRNGVRPPLFMEETSPHLKELPPVTWKWIGKDDCDPQIAIASIADGSGNDVVAMEREIAQIPRVDVNTPILTDDLRKVFGG